MKASQLNFDRNIPSVALLLAIVAIATHTTQTWARGAGQLKAESEIVFTDSQAAVLKANTATGNPQVIAAGQKLSQPFGICVSASGEYLVSDTGSMALIAVNPVTGSQREVTAGGSLGVPFGIASERGGSALVANGAALIRVDTVTGAQQVLSSGGLFRAPVAVAVGGNGAIFVVDIMGAVIQVNPRTGAQSVVSSGGYLQRPQGIAVRGDDIYVTDVGTSDGNFGIGRIVHINARSGRQVVLSEGKNLVGPVGISILSSGDLVVADPYTINEESTTLFDGGIILVNAVTGSQTLLARGQNGFLNPRCISAL